MKILVANLGSTSFKYRLYDLGDPLEPMLARGAVERIGGSEAKVRTQIGESTREEIRPIADHGEAVQLCLDALTSQPGGVIASAADVAAIGFKAVHSRHFHRVHRVDDRVLESMEAYSDVAPAHNPPYVKAMRTLAERFPRLPLIAAFETDFHATIPEENRLYAIPAAWSKLGVRRWGFHGASHRYIATRMPRLLDRSNLRLISCHLGGSSSLCAIRNGESVACSLGMSPQSGLPHNNRVGDFDVFSLPALMRETGLSLAEVLETLGGKSGLQGICGRNDVRDIETAAVAGSAPDSLALGVFVNAIRHYLGAYLVELGGADAIVFTGGIGENSSFIRASVTRNMQWLGVELDPERNQAAHGETRVSADGSKIQVWAVPTNEEIIVARLAKNLLETEA